MNSSKDDYNSKEIDFVLRETLSVLRAWIDQLFLGAYDDDLEERTALLFKMSNKASQLYSMIDSSIVQKANRINELNSEIMMDLLLAKRIQQNILPANIDNIAGLDFSILYRALNEVGGDIYDITEIRPGYTRVFLADATGHGIQAALMTMLIKSEYEKLKAIVQQPNKVLQILNDEIIYTYKSLTMIFSAVVLDIDLTSDKIVYSSAGHPDQLLINSDLTVSGFTSGGKLIGLMEKIEYDQGEMPFNRGDSILLFTDGIYEEFNAEREEYGFNRFEQHVKEQAGAGKPVSEVIDSSISVVEEFTGDEQVNDDTTMLGITRV
jgi:serine phosphatase RsbU (regulator of sigma subunit)